MNEMSSRELLERLIGFATVSRDSNLELIEFIRQYLEELGVESELFYNAERTKANLFATIGPGDRGGIVLSGHTDVVPVDGQAWTLDPFRLTKKRAAVRPRHGGHEGLHRVGAGGGTAAFSGERSGCRSTLRFPMMRKSDASACGRCWPNWKSVRTSRCCA